MLIQPEAWFAITYVTYVVLTSAHGPARLANSTHPTLNNVAICTRRCLPADRRHILTSHRLLRLRVDLFRTFRFNKRVQQIAIIRYRHCRCGRAWKLLLSLLVQDHLLRNACWFSTNWPTIALLAFTPHLCCSVVVIVILYSGQHCARAVPTVVESTGVLWRAAVHGVPWQRRAASGVFAGAGVGVGALAHHSNACPRCPS